ncbi:hypothetical protein N8489_00985 [Akkermansiaceae bacterium]|nr:hypothetical protein [Akkermansiaceae bacterium]
MNQSNIKALAIVPIVLFISIYLGVGAASSQTETLMVVGGVSLVAVIAILGARIWLLIPLVLFSNLFFRWIPGNLALRELAFVVTIAGVTLMALTRRIHFNFRFGLPHLLGGVIVICIAQVYARHPTGLSIFGSGSVGGRPYFIVGLAVMGSMILSSILVRPQDLLSARTFAVVGGVFTIVAQWVAYIPGMGYIMTIAFGTGNMGFMDTNDQSAEGAGRNVAGQATSKALPPIIVAYVSPLKAILFSRWTFIAGFAIFGALISGFRSQIALSGLIFGFGIYYWSGIKGFIAGTLIACISLIFFITLNIFYPLPPKVQRALSFIPGSWEQKYIDDGEDSTDWRVTIWEEALFTDRWIENKVLGDGLGFTKEELSMQQGLQDGSLSLGGFGGLSDQQVSILVNGDYHSGPVSLIRTIGYVGLVLFVIATLVLAVACHKLLRRYKGSPYFGVLAIFLVPAIAHPFYFLFIFGGFSLDIPFFFLNLGFYGLLRNNFHDLHIMDDNSDE